MTNEHNTLDNIIYENGKEIIVKSVQYGIRDSFNKETFKDDLECMYGITPIMVNTYIKEESSNPVIEFEIPESYDNIEEIKLLWKSRHLDHIYGEIKINITNRTLSVNINDIPNYGMGDTVAILYHKDEIMLCHIIQ